MTPPVPIALADMAARLRADVLPQLAGFSANNVAMSAAMLDMVAERWDDAAALLVAENRAFRVLLGEDGADDDPRVNALQRENDRLRAGLIILHAEAEQRDDPEAKAIDGAIWAELARSVERRRVGSANF